MSHFEYVYRDLEQNKHVQIVDEDQARIILSPISRDVDAAITRMRDNPGGQMNCMGGYLRYVA